MLAEDTKFLQSTTSDVVDTWTSPGKSVPTKGGEVQLFQTKVKFLVMEINQVMITPTSRVIEFADKFPNEIKEKINYIGF